MRTCPARAPRPGAFLEPLPGAPRAWQQLKGAALCGAQAALLGAGSGGARRPEAGQGLVSFPSGPEALLALGDGPDSSLPASPGALSRIPLSKKRHLCILRSQMPVLNVPPSERKHIAFPTVVQEETPARLRRAPAGPAGCQVLVSAKPLRTSSGLSCS